MERCWGIVQSHNRMLHGLLCMVLYQLKAMGRMLTNFPQYSAQSSMWKLKPTRIPVSIKILVQSGSLLGEEYISISCF